MLGPTGLLENLWWMWHCTHIVTTCSNIVHQVHMVLLVCLAGFAPATLETSYRSRHPLPQNYKTCVVMFIIVVVTRAGDNSGLMLYIW